jgi:energy-converting hydrogenase Eha subunit G
LEQGQLFASGAVLSGTPRGTVGGAQAHPTYYDRHEEYALVTKEDLREVSTIGWLQEGAAGFGLFFLSGAFWLLVTLIAEHGKDPNFYPWYLACAVISVCGGILVFVGARLFLLKQARLEKYFPQESVSIPIAGSGA